MAVVTLDRRISFEVKTTVKGPTGQDIETWAPAANTPRWAHRRDLQGNERFRSDQELATRVAVFTVRWFSALNAGDYRISHDNAIWDIEGIAEPPNTRRQWWELTCSAVRA